MSLHSCPSCACTPSAPTRPEACRWFTWGGGACCESCGEGLDAHVGLEWPRPGGAGDGLRRRIYVAWRHYGPGLVLDIPLLTSLLRPESLEYLQELSWRRYHRSARAIEQRERPAVGCFCGNPVDRERVHRAHECLPWVVSR